MLDLEWKAAAAADLLAIIDFISEHNPGAAQTLRNDIETKVSRLRKHPRRHRPGRIEGTREMVVRPNYIVVYAENGETVTVLRVLHAARQWP